MSASPAVSVNAAVARANGAVIHTEDLWRTYEMGSEKIHALRGVSFDIQPNEYVAIMGPSGSGKSTLMNLIGCLDTPSKGIYVLQGKVVSEMDDDELASVRNKEIGFVFQTFNLLPRASALQNVELPSLRGVPKDKRIERAKKSLEMVDLADRMTHKPRSSRGQRQRSPSLGPGDGGPRSFSPTSPRATSTRPRARKSCVCSSVCTPRGIRSSS